eukprot:3689169-Rhodomonas_salina.1
MEIRASVRRAERGRRNESEEGGPALCCSARSPSTCAPASPRSEPPCAGPDAASVLDSVEDTHASAQLECTA